MTQTQGEVEVVAPARPEMPTVEDFLLAHPLYAPIYNPTREFLSALRAEPIVLDTHCVWCKANSTFKAERYSGSGARDPDWFLKGGMVTVTVTCQRKHHTYYFELFLADKVVLKYGQFPSLEDIGGADIQKYRPLLRDGYFQELKRATGLASHGIGIGAFVYLRRIFEKLIYDHHVDYAASHGDIDGFASMRMDDKIGALKAALPPALVKNKAAYGILSKGIHELDENTCRKFFPVVRAAIIEILEQDLRQREAQKASDDLEREIAKISGELKGAP